MESKNVGLRLGLGIGLGLGLGVGLELGLGVGLGLGLGVGLGLGLGLGLGIGLWLEIISFGLRVFGDRTIEISSTSGLKSEGGWGTNILGVMDPFCLEDKSTSHVKRGLGEPQSKSWL